MAENSLEQKRAASALKVVRDIEKKNIMANFAVMLRDCQHLL